MVMGTTLVVVVETMAEVSPQMVVVRALSSPTHQLSLILLTRSMANKGI